LLEARELYTAGYFYSCVAMSGIVVERIVKDLLRATVVVQENSTAKIPPSTAFDQFERVEIRGIIGFLKEAELLTTDAARAAVKMGELRNKYAHARGRDAKADAVAALKLVQTVVEDTVSIFKEFEIKDGTLVRKGSAPETG
jgi:hypothetical protein